MKPFSQFPIAIKKNIHFILTDIDDTLTNAVGCRPTSLWRWSV